ncbi:hypothetical protein, partial [Staphylococcus aureus]
LQQRLKLSNAEALRLATVGGLPAWPWHPDDVQARRLLYREGPTRFRDHVLGAWSRDPAAGPGDSRWAHVLSLPERWESPRFP